MEIIFVVTALAFASVLILLVLLAAAGISAAFGASFHAVFVNGLWALLLPPALVLPGYLFWRNSLEVNYPEIVSDRIPASFDGYRIVQISDMHLRSFRDRPEVLSGIIDRVNAENPDLIVFSGDLVTVHPDEITPFADILKGLKAKDGIVSVMGNHDYCPYNKWESEKERVAAIDSVRAKERALGWVLLDNAHVDIVRRSIAGQSRDTVSVIGVENISSMKQFETHGDLEKALKGVKGTFRILVSHDPTHWRAEVLGKEDICLTLSGHTHNAQFRLFGLEPSRLVFKENSGLYTEETAYGKQQLYVNDGLGTTLFPARIGVKAEITVFTLRHDG
ncbi:MAG: metallophosphoesterase [Bacteroidetes bacterium]|uniref:Metallophosphoesterase n=1 Tax=Candidatus Cryptobacteroides faecipullorum TaxID=2840764 RepID=A0A9D9NAD3_9BACT|nr:metallophosphoesterase [Candidatus Cryptobacteroides faecipullorum]